MLYNYNFVLDGVLAGCALPGSNGPLMDDLRQARDAGITDIVTLTEAPLPAASVKEMGLGYLHLPVEDFRAPKMEQIVEFVAFVESVRARKGAVLVHCHGGYGRTGTMLAAYLISQGTDVIAAVERIRQLRPGSIETASQERMLVRYARETGRG